jgi:hypothetical protein
MPPSSHPLKACTVQTSPPVSAVLLARLPHVCLSALNQHHCQPQTARGSETAPLPTPSSTVRKHRLPLNRFATTAHACGTDTLTHNTPHALRPRCHEQADACLAGMPGTLLTQSHIRCPDSRGVHTASPSANLDPSAFILLKRNLKTEQTASATIASTDSLRPTRQAYAWHAQSALHRRAADVIGLKVQPSTPKRL